MLSHFICVWLFATPWTAAGQAFMSIHSVMPSNRLILCFPLLLPSVFPSFRVFSKVSSSHQVAKVLELQLQHQSFQRIFRVDFLQDWLIWSPCSPRDSQESSPTPQFKNINSLALSFLYVQLSHPYMTIGKTIVLSRQTLSVKLCLCFLICCLGWS